MTHDSTNARPRAGIAPLAVLALCLAALLGPARASVAGEPRPLFNGRDLEGWEIVAGDERTWRVEDGILVCSGIPTGMLRTDRMYEDFVLELEWRHLKSGGNAGLFIWADALPAVGSPFVRGIEVQVMDGPNGSWYTTHGDVFPVLGATLEPENGRDSMRAYPTEERSRPAPEWNHYRIECRGGTVTLAVNGKVVTTGHRANPRKGFIHLESEGSEVHFRNLVIEESEPVDPAGPDETATARPGFRPLYNGQDFREWRFEDVHRGHFRARDWRIAYDGGGADLWSREDFGDFELIVDWRWTGEGTAMQRPVIRPDGAQARNEDGSPRTVEVMDAGDSGIYLRGSSKSQVNIWCWPVGSGEVYGYRTDGSMSPEVRAGVTPRVAADRPIGQWNRFEITMVGDRLTVVLNGETVLEDARLPGVAERGPIALQMHGGALEFATVMIREIER